MNGLIRRWYAPALFVVLVTAAWLSSYRLAEPAWEMKHHGYILSEWSHNAANYLRFGLETRTGLVMDYGWLKPGNGFTYRIDHPPLTSLVIALSYAIFGIHEWSARLAPLLFSLALATLVFLFVRRIAGVGWALLATVFAAFSPGFLFYARLPVPHVLAMPFVLATFLAYREWTVTGERKYLTSLWVLFAVGCWTDWIVYFVMPWLLIHYLLFHYRARPDLRFLLIGLSLPFALFASHLVWAWLVGGTEPLRQLMQIFLWRSAAVAHSTAHKVGSTWGDLYKLSYSWVVLYLTSTMLSLALVWSATFVVRVVNRRVLADDFLVLCLFSYGLVHSIAFRNRIYFHDYLTAFQWLPFVAIAGALGVRSLVHLFTPRWRAGASIVLIPLMLWVFLLPLPARLNGLHREQLRPDFYLVGRQVADTVPREAKVMLSFRPDIRLAYYMDRPWGVVTTEAAFDALLAKDPAYSHYLFSSGSAIEEALRRRLIAGCEATLYDGYALFDLRSGRGNTLTTELPPATQRVNVRFGDDLMLLGCDIDPAEVVSAPGPTWWQKHFNAHAEWMPGHNAVSGVTYSWQAMKPLERDYEIRARFVADYEGEHVMDQAHEPVSGFYPTSLWGVGEIVREGYEVRVPADYPPLRYVLRLSVVDKSTGEALPVREVGLGRRIGEDEVEVGVVEVQPRVGPVAMAGEPVMAQRLERELGDGVALVGYDAPFLSSGARQVRAGQRLEVKTYWRAEAELGEDVPAWLELSSGRVRLRSLLGVEPTRLWRVGQVYERRGVLELSSDLLAGEYGVSLVVGGDEETRVELGTVRVEWAGGPRRVIDQMGVADGVKGDVRPLDTDREVRLNFRLDRPQGVDVGAGWVGESLADEVWVEVYVKNERGERYVTTWVVPRGRYAVSAVAVPPELMVVGENSVILRVPAQREKPRYVGWRAWVDAVFPDLLYDTSGPHDGWVWADYVRVESPWREEWGAYRDLARAYAELGMVGEVAELFDRAMEKGLRPDRVEDLNVFAEVFEKDGDAARLAKLEGVVRSLIERPVGVNLGDKVEVVGYTLKRQGEGQAELRVYFRAVSEMGEDYTLWLHGYREGEGGFESLDRRLDTSKWRVGRVYEERWLVPLGGEKVRFVLGLWRWEDGSRLWRKDAPDQHEVDLGWMIPE